MSRSRVMSAMKSSRRRLLTWRSQNSGGSTLLSKCRHSWTKGPDDRHFSQGLERSLAHKSDERLPRCEVSDPGDVKARQRLDRIYQHVCRSYRRLSWRRGVRSEQVRPHRTDKSSRRRIWSARNAILPGAVDTPMYAYANDTAEKGHKQTLGTRIALPFMPPLWLYGRNPASQKQGNNRGSAWQNRPILPAPF